MNDDLKGLSGFRVAREYVFEVTGGVGFVVFEWDRLFVEIPEDDGVPLFAIFEVRAREIRAS
jgi:hypothetical protein